ncbi:MAG: putative deoxyribonuclease RhsB [Chlamydiae bacterium]|nr:putative deoxyribonuclease RhsB [Chlamydiota bacterium]
MKAIYLFLSLLFLSQFVQAEESDLNAEMIVKATKDQEGNLLASERNGAKTTIYEYYPQTDQVRLKLVLDGEQIRERQFMAFDDNGTMILEIVDDGSTSDIDNLSGVTERLIKKVQTSSTRPLGLPIGLPGVIEELYLDLPTGDEILLKRAVNSYSKEGFLTRQDVYDCNGDFSYLKEWAYDAMGNVLEETDPLGQKTTYKYDRNGSCIFKQTPNLFYYTTYLYDFANRRIREEEIYTNGRCLIKTFQYNLKGDCICSTDIYGSSIRYIYDAFGRMVEKIFPHILDGNNNDYKYQPSEKIEYDIFNNPVLKTDCNGNVTNLAYNTKGKLCWMQHPDGSIEKNEHNLDGTTRKSIDPEGVMTLYFYDYNQRKTKEEKYSTSGELLSTKMWTYGAYHLLSETDAKGNSTTYEYDGAGRVSAVRKEAMETRYVYDSLGRIHETKELYEEGQYRRTIEEHDLLGQVIEERIEDDQGNILSRKAFAYDADGNRTHVSVASSSGESCTIAEYNSHKKPIKIIAPDGQITTITHHYNYCDGWGKLVATEEKIDPRGTVTLRVKDTHGRLASEERKNAIGEVVSRVSYRYDGNGNLVRKYDDIIVAGEKKNTVCTVFEYDSRNNQSTIVEAYGEPEQKTTKKEYTSRGQVSRIMKPDGIFLDYQYDDLRRLVEMRSSDSTVHYTYAYDLNDNTVSVEDHVYHLTTKRTFDRNDQMISETLDHGAHLRYGYDLMGRLVEFILPDSTKVSYKYDAKHLRSITRKSNDQNYTHHYYYDLSGKISLMILPRQVGEAEFSYDAALKPIAVSSEYFSQQVPKGGYDACGNMLSITQKDAAGEVQVNYSYDSLHRLITEEGIVSHSYRFDSLGNRVCKDDIPYENNALHQLVSEDQNQYYYDLSGNLISRESASQNKQYQYDALGRLVVVISDTQKAVYRYDGFHRRMSKTIYNWKDNDWKETSGQKYLYQKKKEVGVVANDGTIKEFRILSAGYKGNAKSAVAFEFGKSTYIPLHDFRGNVVGLVDAKTKEIVEAYRYTAYGEETVFDGAGQPKENAINPWRFRSKRVDPETGWNNVGCRYYDPVVGRWTHASCSGLRMAPIFFVTFNLENAVQNRPMMFMRGGSRG